MLGFYVHLVLELKKTERYGDKTWCQHSEAPLVNILGVLENLVKNKICPIYTHYTYARILCTIPQSNPNYMLQYIKDDLDHPYLILQTSIKFFGELQLHNAW